MTACPTVTTERLLLRPFREEDVDAYHAILLQPRVKASLHIPDDLSRDDAWGRIARYLGQWELRGTGQWALEERATGRFVGAAGTHWPRRENWPGIEVGWTLDEDVWGRGYATEAGRAGVDHAFTSHDVDAVFSCILDDNLRSQAVARRLGLRLHEHRVIPALGLDGPIGIWRLARPDWHAPPAVAP